MPRRAVLALVLTSLLAACGKGPGTAEKKANADADRVVQVAAEDLVTVRTNALSSGPVITGTIQPERRADLRAEVSAVVLQVLKDNGDAVKRGDLLARLDDTSIRDSVVSAEESVRALTQSLDQAERQFQRLKTLRGSGMASAQQLEDAEIRRNNVQSDLVAAKARLVQARQQLQRTEVRAPFDGVISERKVSTGDTAQIGKELVKVVDPASLRFEGTVSADKIDKVKMGQQVVFRVNGQGQQEYLGKVKRVDPAANPTTRQVEVLVGLGEGPQPRLAGLYAEGRIEVGGVNALMVPEAALQRDGDKAYAWRVRDNTLNKVTVTLGERDPRRGDFVVRAGLAEGDKLIRNPSSALKDGQKVAFGKPPVPAPTASVEPAEKSTVAAGK